jgi:hypothetical protein
MAPELDSYIDKMPPTRAHGVNTNEDDDRVYGDCPAHELALKYDP